MNLGMGVSSINEFAEFGPNPNVVQISDAVEEIMEKYSSKRSVTMQGDMANSRVGSLRRSNTGKSSNAQMPQRLAGSMMDINAEIIRMSAPYTIGSRDSGPRKSCSNLQARFTADNFIPGVSRIPRYSESQVSLPSGNRIYDTPRKEIDEIAKRYSEKQMKIKVPSLDK